MRLVLIRTVIWCVSAEQVGSTPIATALNMLEGAVEQRSAVAGEPDVVVDTRVYAHRTMMNLLVAEFNLTGTSSKPIGERSHAVSRRCEVLMWCLSACVRACVHPPCNQPKDAECAKCAPPNGAGSKSLAWVW